MLGFTACEQDTDPVYKAPTTFELNIPAMQDQYIDLQQEGTFELVAAAQPDYGYSAVTNYSAIVSLTEDFTETVELKSVGTGTQSRMEFNNSDLAVAICALKGITGEDNYVEEPAIPVYFRGVAQLNGVESSRIESKNYVVLKHVKYYFAVPVPGYIYLVGSVNGWNEPKESNKGLYTDWRLFESDNAIGSHVYTGVFDMPAGDLYFRFYSELTGWDGGASLGIQVDDSSINIEMEDGAYNGALVHGKGSFGILGWEGGEMTITVNMANDADMSVSFVAGAVEVFTPRYVYMVGNNAGWKEPSADNADIYNQWVLVDKRESGVYTGTFDFTGFEGDGAGNLYCRFYQALEGWGAAQWSADAAGGNVDIDFGTAQPTFVGEGCFTGDVKDTVVTITLDTNNNTVLFEQE